MNPSTRTPEGEPHRCPICGHGVVIEPSTTTRDAPCPSCGSLLWFTRSPGREQIYGLHRFQIFDRSINTKEQVFNHILDRLVESESLPREHREGVLAALLKREELGSTGIGRGIAMPHAKFPGLENIAGAFVKVTAGIDFDSLDGQPVHLICLVVSSADRPGDHLRVLEFVSRRLREADHDPLSI